jgi:hypothetical protein
MMQAGPRRALLLSDLPLRSAFPRAKQRGSSPGREHHLMPKEALRCFLAAALGTFFLTGGPSSSFFMPSLSRSAILRGRRTASTLYARQEGVRIATGDVTQDVHGDIVTTRLIFHFRDGSIDEDTTVFSQRGVFRLISDHHIQHGPSFPKPTDILIDALHGLTTSRDESGKVRQNHLDLPPDLANGLPPNLLLNILPSVAETDISNNKTSPHPCLTQAHWNGLLFH